MPRLAGLLMRGGKEDFLLQYSHNPVSALLLFAEHGLPLKADRLKDGFANKLAFYEIRLYLFTGRRNEA